MANATEIGVAYLGIRPKMDANFESDIESQGASGGKGFGKHFGGAFAVAAGNLIGDAIGNITSAAVNTFKDAFSSYSTYEQLAGGVEKIFDQADIGGIMEDAQRAYKDLNMSANEYLESINQTGAAFAQTMGDQKGYDTARQGMKAISDYASGTGRDLGELNEKFALITRATSSYQSIADQFSGILPATSADFLAQAQAAGLLSGEYKKLTDVPIAEYQQAVSAMLEKGVSDMGLLGNTAAESTNTISGSLAMLSAAWTNFTTELGKDSADMPARAGELVESIVAVVQNIGPRLLVFAQNLFAALPTLIDTLMPYIDQLVQMAAAFLEEHQTEIQAAGETMFNGIKEALKVVAAMAIQALIELVKDVIVTLPEWYPQIQQAAFELFLGILEGLVSGIDPFMRQLEDMINGAIGAVLDSVERFWQGGADIVNGIVEGVRGGIDAVRGIFEDVLEAMTHPIETAQEIIEGIIGAIEDAFSWMHIDIPSFELPHIEVDWWDTGFGVSIPSFYVDWYAQGGIVDGAQLIGAGERGAELVWPSYEPYLSQYADAIASRMGGAGGVDIHDCVFEIRQESDIRRVAVELNTLINRQLAGGRA